MLHSGPRPRRNTSLYPYLAPLIWDTILVMEAWGQGEKRLDLGLGRRGGSPGGSGEVICLQCRRPRLGPQSGRSPGEGNDNPLRYSCLENSIDRGAWQATVHGVSRVGHDLMTTPPFLKQFEKWRNELFIFKFQIFHTLRLVIFFFSFLAYLDGV